MHLHIKRFDEDRSFCPWGKPETTLTPHDVIARLKGGDAKSICANCLHKMASVIEDAKASLKGPGEPSRLRIFIEAIMETKEMKTILGVGKLALLMLKHNGGDRYREDLEWVAWICSRLFNVPISALWGPVTASWLDWLELEAVRLRKVKEDVMEDVRRQIALQARLRTAEPVEPQ
jgi:hypothetical protein